jgi:hypothetical protein
MTCPTGSTRTRLEEALTHGPDPLHLAEVFGLDEKTAMRYADSARALLERRYFDHQVISAIPVFPLEWSVTGHQSASCALVAC